MTNRLSVIRAILLSLAPVAAAGQDANPIPELVKAELDRIVEAIRWPAAARMSSKEWLEVNAVHAMDAWVDGLDFSREEVERKRAIKRWNREHIIQSEVREFGRPRPGYRLFTLHVASASRMDPRLAGDWTDHPYVTREFEAEPLDVECMTADEQERWISSALAGADATRDDAAIACAQAAVALCGQRRDFPLPYRGHNGPTATRIGGKRVEVYFGHATCGGGDWGVVWIIALDPQGKVMSLSRQRPS